jgi:hypothetical protein
MVLVRMRVVVGINLSTEMFDHKGMFVSHRSERSAYRDVFHG